MKNIGMTKSFSKEMKLQKQALDFDEFPFCINLQFFTFEEIRGNL